MTSTTETLSKVIRANAARPNRYGATHACTPSSNSNVAFRYYQNTNVVECLSIQDNNSRSSNNDDDGGGADCGCATDGSIGLNISTLGTMSIRSRSPTVTLVHMACSYDARLLLLVISDGSLHCYNVVVNTNNNLGRVAQFHLRWIERDIHSHSNTALGTLNASNATTADASLVGGGASAGPVRSLAFAPSSIESYLCFLVDSFRGSIYVLDAQIIGAEKDGGKGRIVWKYIPKNNPVQQQQEKQDFDEMLGGIGAASWCSTVLPTTSGTNILGIVVGGHRNGNIALLNIHYNNDEMQLDNSVTIKKKIIPPIISMQLNNKDDEAIWCCTHLDWFRETDIAVGLCRVIPDINNDDENQDLYYSTTSNEEEDEDDNRHEANLLLYNTSNDHWIEMGDVNPFFSVPKYGRHVFYTSYISALKLEYADILLVGSNLSSDVAVLFSKRGDNDNNHKNKEKWGICEFLEGAAASTPITHDDEFTYTTGLVAMYSASGRALFGISATDGSSSLFGFEEFGQSLGGSPWKPIRSSHSGGADHNSVRLHLSGLIPQGIILSRGKEIVPDKKIKSVNDDDALPPSKSTRRMTNKFSSFGLDSATTTSTKEPISLCDDATISTTIDNPLFGFSVCNPIAKNSTPFNSLAKARTTPCFVSSTKNPASSFGSSSDSKPIPSSINKGDSNYATTGTKTTIMGTTSQLFGLSSTKPGTFSLGSSPLSKIGISTSTSINLPSKLSSPNYEANTRVFGSTTTTTTITTTPVFGSGSKIPTFGSILKKGDSNTGEIIGFASLAKSMKENSLANSFSNTKSEGEKFAFGNLKKSLFGGFATVSHINNVDNSSTLDPKMIKPLFDTTKTIEKTLSSSFNSSDSNSCSQKSDDENEDKLGILSKSTILLPTRKEREATKNINQTHNSQASNRNADTKEDPQQQNVSSLRLVETAKSAFDNVDIDKDGMLKIDEELERLLDEIGEGFYGDELDKQITLLDPQNTGFVNRSAFVGWYCQLVKGDDDTNTLDTEEREEREGERSKAMDCFKSVAEASKDTIPKSEFGKLMEAMGTTYCDEEHRQTIKKISDDSGSISEEAFVEWYMEWLFGNDDDSDSGLDKQEQDENRLGVGSRKGYVVETGDVLSTDGWGDSFFIEKGSWKCDSCMVLNENSAMSCVACNVVRSGNDAEGKEAKKDNNTKLVTNMTKFGVATSQSALTGRMDKAAFSFGVISASKPSEASIKGISSSFGSNPVSISEPATVGGFSFGVCAPTVGSGGVNSSLSISAILSSDINFTSPALDRNDDCTNNATKKSFEKDEVVIWNNEAKMAETAFDSVDVNKISKLKIDEELERLLDEIGEGFYGDELDKQITLLDPQNTGFVNRSAFVGWYCQLVKGDDDTNTLDTEEREEREGERSKAMDCFKSVAEASKDTIPKSEFGKLMEAMGTTYCDEEHRQTIKRISDDSGSISEEAFVEWYMEWLFGNDDDSDSGLDKQEQDENRLGVGSRKDYVVETGDVLSTDGWGDSFFIEKGSWKCDSCMVLNENSAMSCVACNVVRSGNDAEGKEAKKDNNTKLVTNMTKFGVATSQSALKGRMDKAAFSFGVISASKPSEASIKGISSSFGSNPVSISEPAAVGGFSFGVCTPTVEFTSEGGLSSEFCANLSSSGVTSSDSDTTFPNRKKEAFVEKPPSLVKALSSTKESKEVPKAFDSSTKSLENQINLCSSESPYLPISHNTSKPFDGGVVNNSTTSTSSGKYPPSSKAAPKPFGSSTTNIQSKSNANLFGSSYPPMSLTAPKPFGGEHSSSTKASRKPFGSFTTNIQTRCNANSSGPSYQPVSRTPPKPFGGKPSSSTSSGEYPPMSETAPRAFLSTTTNIESKLNVKLSYTPRSRVALKPFGNKSNSLTLSGKYYPLLETVPKPFGLSATNIESKSNVNSSPSSYQPMSRVAPNRFGTESNSSTSSGQYSPLSKTAPKPFGSSATNIESKFNRNSSASSYPPMSRVAPNCFGTESNSSTSPGQYPPLSKTAPKPFGSSVTKIESKSNANSSTSSYPPMSRVAPNPFGGERNSSTPSEQYPPLSNIAPKPFGSSVTKIESKSNANSSTSSYPPMSRVASNPFIGEPVNNSKPSVSSGISSRLSKGTKPFGSSTTNLHLNPITNLSSSCPPVSLTVPNLYIGGPVNNSKPSASAEGYPPLSKTAPKPFGSSTSTQKNMPNTSSIESSYPPISVVAPEPFRGGTIRRNSQASSVYPPSSKTLPKHLETRSNAESSTSPYPPISLVVPKSFSGNAISSIPKALVPSEDYPLSIVTEKVLDISTANRGKKQNMTASISSYVPVDQAAQKTVSEYCASSEYEVQLWQNVRSFLTILDDLELKVRCETNRDILDLENSIKNLLGHSEKVKSTTVLLHDEVQMQLQLTLFLLSRGDEISRQLEESKRIIKRQQNINTDEPAELEFSKDQPLDLESEKFRRRLGRRSIIVQGAITHIRGKIRLIEDISTYYAPIKSVRGLSRKSKSLEIFYDSVRNGYERTKALDVATVRLNKCIANRAELLNRKETITKKKENRNIVPFPFRSPVTSKDKQLNPCQHGGNGSIISALRELNRTVRNNNVNNISLNSLSRDYAKEQVTSSLSFPFRSRSGSLLMNAESVGTFHRSESSSIMGSMHISTPPLVRKGWTLDCNLDGKGVEEVTLSLPSTLKQIDAKKAARKALSAFGTTPEKITEAQQIRRRRTMTSINKKSTEIFPKVLEDDQVLNKKNSAVTFSPTLDQNETMNINVAATTVKNLEMKPAASVSLLDHFKKKNSVNATATFAEQIKISSDMERNLSETKELSSTLQSLDNGNIQSTKKRTPLSTLREKTVLKNDMKSFDTEVTKLHRNDQLPDYYAIMIEFYRKHNPAKLGEVTKTLQKYKGRETEMFGKLAKKYGVSNPLQTSSKGPGVLSSSETNANELSMSAIPSSASSLFGTAKSSSQSTQSPFGSIASQSTSILSGTSNTPFGNTSNLTKTSFGSASTEASSAFGMKGKTSLGQLLAPIQTSFGVNTASTSFVNTGQIRGESSREVLLAFYQKRNPLKISEVDNLLAKYSGKEEQLFRNLAKKYGVDPATFGLTAHASGCQSVTRGSSLAFGQTSGPNSSASTTFGAQSEGGFGSFAQIAQPSGSFASLAAENPSPVLSSARFSSFKTASPVPATFGSPTPFGAARR